MAEEVSYNKEVEEIKIHQETIEMYYRKVTRSVEEASKYSTKLTASNNLSAATLLEAQKICFNLRGLNTEVRSLPHGM